MMATEALLSLDEFFDLPEEPGVRRELLRGRVIELERTGFEHHMVWVDLSHVLHRDCGPEYPSFLISGRSDFVLTDDTVLAPDAVLLSHQKYGASKRFRDALRCAPDLAVEVVPPDESAEDLDDKIGLYLENGTTTVWVIWPKRRHAMIYHHNGAAIHVRNDGYLEAPDLIPRIRIRLSDAFRQIDRANWPGDCSPF